MSTTSREQLLNFISHNQLKKEDGIICFEADIHFHQPVAVETVSEIQVISLPFEHALYVINYPATVPRGGDVYSTAKFNFIHEGDRKLIITTAERQTILAIELKQSCVF